jgi:SH3-like domain-containing protein
LIEVANHALGSSMSTRSIPLALVTTHRQAAASVLSLLFGLTAVGDLLAQGTPGAPVAGVSGMPLPRFVSLKSDRVNLRQGPGTEYPTAWVFRRVGLPVEVINEFEGWRQVRDAEGTTGWVASTLLSGRRTAVVLPWEVRPGRADPTVAVLRNDDSEASKAVAQVEAGVLANIISCDGRWCRVSVDGFRGYIEQSKLWGAYQGEVIK